MIRTFNGFKRNRVGCEVIFKLVLGRVGKTDDHGSLRLLEGRGQNKGTMPGQKHFPRDKAFRNFSF